MAASPSTSIRLSRLALLLAAVIAPLATIAIPLAGWLSGEPLDVPIRAGDPEPLPGSLARANAGTSLEWDGGAVATIADPSAQERLIALLPEALIGIVVALAALQLLRVIDQISCGAAFAPATVRVLRRVALLIVAAALVIPLVQAFASAKMTFAAVANDVSGWSSTFPLAWFGAAALVGAIAEAFAQGVRMRHDVEGLV